MILGRPGYGTSGPDRDNVAMDLTIQAHMGIMDATGFPSGDPVKVRESSLRVCYFCFVTSFDGDVFLLAAAQTGRRPFHGLYGRHASLRRDRTANCNINAKIVLKFLLKMQS